MWDIAATNTKDELVRRLGRSADGSDPSITRLGSGSLFGKDFEEAYAYVPDALTAPQL